MQLEVADAQTTLAQARNADTMTGSSVYRVAIADLQVFTGN